jgi:NAD(P)H-flavin reductase
MVQAGIRRKCTLYFGALQRRDLYLLDELRKLESEQEWFTFVPALSAPGEEDDWTGETGLITDVLDRHLRDPADIEVYLCGSPEMIAAGRVVLQRKGIPSERTFFDEYLPARMQMR